MKLLFKSIFPQNLDFSVVCSAGSSPAADHPLKPPWVSQTPWAPEAHWGLGAAAVLNSLSTLLRWRTVIEPELPDWDRLGGQYTAGVLLPLKSQAGTTGKHGCAWILHGCWGWDLYPTTCVALFWQGHLPSSQLALFFLTIKRSTSKKRGTLKISLKLITLLFNLLLVKLHCGAHVSLESGTLLLTSKCCDCVYHRLAHSAGLWHI